MKINYSIYTQKLHENKHKYVINLLTPGQHKLNISIKKWRETKMFATGTIRTLSSRQKRMFQDTAPPPMVHYRKISTKNVYFGR